MSKTKRQERRKAEQRLKYSKQRAADRKEARAKKRQQLTTSLNAVN